MDTLLPVQSPTSPAEKCQEAAKLLMDRETALSRVGGDVGLLREVAAIFIDEYPKGLAELRTALHAGDVHTFERTAHGLKGSVATFGAPEVVAAAFELEQLGRAQNLSAAPSTLEMLAQQLGQLHLELEAI